MTGFSGCGVDVDERLHSAVLEIDMDAEGEREGAEVGLDERVAVRVEVTDRVADRDFVGVLELDWDLDRVRESETGERVRVPE
jgi:hypothetical protein